MEGLGEKGVKRLVSKVGDYSIAGLIGRLI